MKVSAYANNEVAYVSWEIDGKIDGCLGFEVTRVYVDEDGNELEGESRVRCASWVPFAGQRNPNWLPQDTGIWPVQKLEWRDLTARKRRDALKRRPEDVLVRYEVRPLADYAPGMEKAPDATPRQVRIKDEEGNTVQVPAYEGKPRQLGYLAKASASETVAITRHHPPFKSTFTNGILAAQWLRKVLLADGEIKPNELLHKIENPEDPHRRYLAGDVLPQIHEFFASGDSFYLALYELEDQELLDLLLANGPKVNLILANSGESKGKWDARNSAARQALIDAGVKIEHRMFNNNSHIGHNKFVVRVIGDEPEAVLTGSTNWTSTGVAGQTNNCLVIDDGTVAGQFLAYWRRLKDDALGQPASFGDTMKDNRQGQDLRKANMESFSVVRDEASIVSWFSPNTKAVTKGKAIAPDLSEVYRRMRGAREAILFLVFYPAQQGRDCIIEQAISMGVQDRELIVAGAVSDPKAMPNYVAPDKNDPGDASDDVVATAPRTYVDANVSLVRASRIDEQTLLADFGMEQLTPRGTVGAIIHDKIVVIDPLSPDCTVILGSHNLGYKASYCNDENLLIISGNRALAEAYAVHVLDVYDHYRFRAIQAEQEAKHKKGWSGNLDSDDSWMDAYADGRKGALARYFAKGRR